MKAKPNGEIKIEKNVPIPVRKALNRKYPFDRMEVGDSFFATGTKQSAITGAFNFYHPKKFSCRTQKDDKGNFVGVRVWRIA